MKNKIDIRFEGRIKDGEFKLLPKERELFKIHCRTLKDGIYFLPAPKKIRGLRSDKQFGYYWILMTILQDEIGHSKDEFHELCKYLFLREKHPFFGVSIPASTSTTDKYRFIQYIDDIRMWAAMSYLEDGTYEVCLPFSIILPDPKRIDIAA